jgi:hypothetical protein
VVGDRREVAGAALLEEQGKEVRLVQQVSELVDQSGVVAGLGCVGHLVGLLDRVRHDRSLVLLAVPRALAPQVARDLVQPEQRLRQVT